MAVALDVLVFERVAAQVAQLVKPCDAQRALLIDHAALALDELVFVRIATQGAHYTPV